MKKKFVWILVVLLVGSLAWYLFVRPYEYIVTFRLSALPGTINQSVKTWNSTLGDAMIVEQHSLGSFKQKVRLADRTYLYQWEIELLNDSTSGVSIFIVEPGQSIMNKLLIPFVRTRLEVDAENMFRNFYEKITEHLQKFRVRVEGLGQFEATYCVYIPVTTNQIGKAHGMMANYSLLSSFVAENEIETNGMPFLEVTEWKMDKDEISFNFCYPIKSQESLPEHDLLKYKQIDTKQAIKAIYNGNYITSDRAWYALRHYAEKNNLQTVDLPLEVFFNNPNFDSNEKAWKAEIYLPLK